MPYDAPTWALAAMLHGIRPGDGYFGLSQPGVLSVSDDGRVQFRPLPNGKHTHLSLDPAQKDHILKTFTEMVSAKPVFPQRRRPT